MNRSRIVVAIALVLLTAPSALARNGISLIGVGPVSSAMGGTGVAGITDARAISLNPANLVGIERTQWFLDGGLLLPKVKQDGTEGRTTTYPFLDVGFAQRSYGGNLTWGIGVFSLGAVGTTFDYSVRAGGTTYETLISSGLTFVKIMPAVTYSFGERFSVGAAPIIARSTFDLDFWQEVPGVGYFIDKLSDYGFGGAAGLSYRAGSFKAGLSYSSPLSFSFDGDINFPWAAEGERTFPVTVEGITWPQKLSLGVGYAVLPALYVEGNVSWVNWSAAFEEITLKATKKTEEETTTWEVASFPMDWEDRVVYGLGIAFSPTENLTFRAGYNYGKNPVPGKTVTPLFPALTEQHVTFGAGYKVETWSIDAALEYAPAVSATNTADRSESMFSGTEVEASALALHLGFRYGF